MSRELAYVQKTRKMIVAVKIIVRAILVVIVVLIEIMIVSTLRAAYIVETIMCEEPTKNS